MAVVSFATKMKNDMEVIEKESDRYIEPSNYYILHLQEINALPQYFEKIKTFGKSLLTRNNLHIPLCVYIFENHIYAVFSCTDNLESPHYLDGSHHSILSEYASILSVSMGASSIKCNIIQFLSQTQIVSYFTWKIYTHSKNYILQRLQKKSDETITELVQELRISKNVEWEELSSDERYGTFYKLKKQNEKLVISTLSEYMDASKFQKYIQYIFGISS